MGAMIPHVHCLAFGGGVGVQLLNDLELSRVIIQLDVTLGIFLWLPYTYIFKTGPPVFANRCVLGKPNHQPFSLDRFASLYRSGLKRSVPEDRSDRSDRSS